MVWTVLPNVSHTICCCRRLTRLSCAWVAPRGFRRSSYYAQLFQTYFIAMQTFHESSAKVSHPFVVLKSTHSPVLAVGLSSCNYCLEPPCAVNSERNQALGWVWGSVVSVSLPLVPVPLSMCVPCMQSANSYSTLMELTLSGEKVASKRIRLFGFHAVALFRW